MAKRFTDSEKFRDKWYRGLSPKHKCLWEYLLSECSIAGIIEFDYDSATFHIGDEITENDIKIFENKIYILPDGKFFIPNYVKFQQGEINPNNKAHKNIIKEFEKYNIPTDINSIEFESTFIAPSKVLDRSPSNSNSNSNSVSNSNGNSKIILIDSKTKKTDPYFSPIKKEEKELKKYGEFQNVKLTDEQFNKLKAIYNSKIDEAIEILSNYLAAKGDKYKNHYAVLNKSNWVYSKVFADKKPEPEPYNVYM